MRQLLEERAQLFYFQTIAVACDLQDGEGLRSADAGHCREADKDCRSDEGELRGGGGLDNRDRRGHCGGDEVAVADLLTRLSEDVMEQQCDRLEVGRQYREFVRWQFAENRI